MIKVNKRPASYLSAPPLPPPPPPPSHNVSLSDTWESEASFSL